jgi:integrator complex subunit 5
MLLDTLSQCCSRNPGGMTQLSLLIVEIVSPDVMFNGLVWPDEDFTKVFFNFQTLN